MKAVRRASKIRQGQERLFVEPETTHAMARRHLALLILAVLFHAATPAGITLCVCALVNFLSPCVC